jgi:hypothetical protein
MLLSLLVACASSPGGSNLGTGGDRVDFASFVPDTGGTTGETGTTGGTGDTGLPVSTSEPLLVSLTLEWGSDSGEGYLEAMLSYYDVPDDVNGGTFYLTVEQDGETLADNDDYEVVDAAGWDATDAEAAIDEDEMTVTGRLYGADMTTDADVSIVLKDSAGHRSEAITGSITGEEATK